MVSVGTIIWLSSELMFFAALFAMYFSIRATDIGKAEWAQHTPVLNLPWALSFTIVLVLSSVTCQIGVFRAERGDVHGLRRWFALTFVMGLTFVLGQVNEYRNLAVCVERQEARVLLLTFADVALDARDDLAVQSAQSA